MTVGHPFDHRKRTPAPTDTTGPRRRRSESTRDTVPLGEDGLPWLERAVGQDEDRRAHGRHEHAGPIRRELREYGAASRATAALARSYRAQHPVDPEPRLLVSLGLRMRP